MNTKLIAIAAMSAFAAVGAHAFQGEQNPLPAQPFQSTQSRAEVQGAARMPVQIGNGGTGVATAGNSMTDRGSVRAGAQAITRAGAATYGEVTDRRL